MSKSVAAVSVEQVGYLAQRVGLKIQRLAPSWGWFMTDAENKKKKFASNNSEAFSLLQQMLESMSAQSDQQVWYCEDPRGLRLKDKKGNVVELESLAVCARSTYHAVKMLNGHFGCGKGKKNRSMRYKFTKYWQRGWPPKMSSVAREHGIYSVVDLQKMA